MNQVLSPRSARNVMAKTLMLISMVFLANLLSDFLFLSPLNAQSRGVRIVPKGGKELYLYNDYHAVVVGVSVRSGRTCQMRSKTPRIYRN